MRKYYTRPCNFYYGDCAKKLIKEKKAFSLAGRSNLAFDHVEVFDRQKKKIIKSNYYSITKIQKLEKNIVQAIKRDLKNITQKEKVF